MLSIHADNVNEALYEGAMLFKNGTAAMEVRSRGLLTLEWPGPVATTYKYPNERVLFHAERDANPFFHFFEGLWMLAGRNDVEFLKFFNKAIKQFSDDGITHHGAYGYRLRKQQGFDQIQRCIDLLKTENETRRAVLQMWDAKLDLAANSKDIPCNDLIFLKIRNNQLNMTVCCRSNDMVWGAYGANAVHFSMIQEYIADKVGVELGSYTQMSDSFHVYLEGMAGEAWNRIKDAGDLLAGDMYGQDRVKPFPMFANDPDWDRDLYHFFDLFDHWDSARCAVIEEFCSPFFRAVVAPMMQAWQTRRLSDVLKIAATDWRLAAEMWIQRRMK